MYGMLAYWAKFVRILHFFELSSGFFRGISVLYRLPMHTAAIYQQRASRENLDDDLAMSLCGEVPPQSWPKPTYLPLGFSWHFLSLRYFVNTFCFPDFLGLSFIFRTRPSFAQLSQYWASNKLYCEVSCVPCILISVTWLTHVLYTACNMPNFPCHTLQLSEKKT